MVNEEQSIYTNSISLSETVGNLSIKNIDLIDDGYYHFNMYIMPDGKTVAYRNSNFRPQTDASGKNSFITVGTLSNNSIVDSRVLKCRGYGIPLWDRYNGMEDPKLFQWRGRTWCLFVRPNHHISRIFMVLMDIESGESHIINDPLRRQFTKNWMPYIKNDRLYFVIDVSPLRVYEFDGERLFPVYENDYSIGNLVIHGGSNIIEFDDKIVGLVHGSFDTGNGWFYWHSVAQWTNEWQSIRLGRPFYFQEKTIEFSLSMQRIEGKIVIPFSIRDDGIKIASMTDDQFRKLL